MSLTEDILKNYLNPILVETGTYLGNGVEIAKRVGFNKILSIEVSKMIWERTQERFIKDDSITIIHGDSVKVLWSVIENIKERMTFVLDAHSLEYSKDIDINKAELEEWPLVKELQIITQHPRKDHTIIIDDVRLFKLFNTNIEEIESLLFEINSDYRIHFISGLLESGIIKAEDIMIAEVVK